MWSSSKASIKLRRGIGFGARLVATGFAGANAAEVDISDERDRNKADSARGSILAGETTIDAAVTTVDVGAAKEFDWKMEASRLLTSSDFEKKCVQVAIVCNCFGCNELGVRQNSTLRGVVVKF